MPYNPKSPVFQMWKRYKDAIAQFKCNGTNCQLTIHPDGKIELWSRHRLDERGRPSPSGVPQRIKNYSLPTDLADRVRGFSPRGSYTIWNVELMHFKTRTVKDCLYFFDVLVYGGKHLLGVNYAKRYELLEKLESDGDVPTDAENLNTKIFVARNIPANEWDLAWQQAQSCSYIEGLMLKRTGPVSSLTIGDREKNNGGFMCKIRKPTKNALF